MLLIFWFVTVSNVNLPWMPVALFVGSLIVNYPHYAATYHRVYRRWDDMKQYPFETIWTPLFLIAMAFVSFQSPAAAPWYCLGYLMFSGYHYSGQTYGIALIFAGKSGVRLASWEKWILLIPIYAVYLYPVLLGNMGNSDVSQYGGDKAFYGLTLPNLSAPEPLPSITWWAFHLGIIAYAALTINQIRKKQPFPMIVHLVFLSHITWFYTIAQSSKYFMMMIPFFHCLQYLVITAYFHYRHSEIPPELNAMGFVRTPHFGRYYLWLIIVGAIMFVPTPYIIEGMGWAKLNVATAIVVSFINMHHFVLDAAIWKLRKPEIGQPLMTSAS